MSPYEIDETIFTVAKPPRKKLTTRDERYVRGLREANRNTKEAK